MTSAPLSDFRVAAWQGEGVSCDVAANLQIVRDRARDARGADLLVFPECFLTGYNIGESARRLAIDRAGPEAAEMSAIARENGLALLCGAPVRDGRSVRNAALLFDADGGAAGCHFKRFLYGEWEKSVFAPGDDSPCVAGIGEWKIGALICYDVEFPEPVRRLAVCGAALAAVPTALMAPDHAPVFSLLPARALENTMFLAYVNRVGTENGMRFVGGSRILAPDGSVLAQADESGETLLRATLKAGDLRRARARFSYLPDFLEKPPPAKND